MIKTNKCLICFSHSLLDAKITSVLSLCHDQVILSAVQSIIQNMIACEESQQQPHYLQS
jgi:neurofibromin 1